MKFAKTPQPTNARDSNETPEGPLETVRFGDVLAPLKAALGQNQGWLNDFCNDNVLLPRDLYDVIQAFAQMQSNPDRPCLAEVS